MTAAQLFAVPNVSEGRDPLALAAIGDAFTRAGATVLDVHSDPDHHRSVFWLTAPPQRLAHALLEGARQIVQLVDVSAHEGLHPHVGALDVAPIVYIDPAQRGATAAEALVLGDLLATELELPVLLYGELAGGRTRAELRKGGPATLARRLEAGEIRPDFGPPRLHPTAGATLLSARSPLVAFNVELAPPATEADAKRIAAAIREGGPEGLPGLRAIGLTLDARGGVAQVSMNVEDPFALPLEQVVESIACHAPIHEAELVGLAPAAAFDGFPEDVPVRNRRTLEDALGEGRGTS